MRDINKSFYGVSVLEDVSLKVRPGEVHVLLGENGAGKSTLIKILSGAYRRETGEIYLEGKPLKPMNPKEAIDAGISVIYQEFNLNPHVPIYENIFMGKEFGGFFRLDKKKAIAEAEYYMDMIGFKMSPTTLVSKLSVAQKQMLEILKALSASVKILVLDEPTAALTDKETAILFDIIRELKKTGIGIIYISHRLSELFEIGDRCSVMRDGKLIKTLDLNNTNMDELVTLMVGRSIQFKKINNPFVQPDYTMLKVKNLNYRKILKDVSLDLRKGEILGIAGLVGSGRTEVAKCIIGAYKRNSGVVTIHNGKTEIKGIGVSESLKENIVYLSEDRKDEGLVLKHSVEENIGLPNLDKFGRYHISKKKSIAYAIKYIKKLGIKATSYRQKAETLSGGNQQKCVIAKWLSTDAEIYIFDEPTRGIDVGAREEIYNIMYNIIKNGNSIILIASDLIEIMKMCDRIAIMHEGRLVAILDNTDDLTQKGILEYALHGGTRYEHNGKRTS
ncbi:MAG: sugar ABC transporter ATP-binding protein, partial [Christensenellales bacterium]|jgi:ribose transport system ATP-binding protein